MQPHALNKSHENHKSMVSTMRHEGKVRFTSEHGGL